MENRTLIAYTPKGGATEKIAKRKADILHAKYGLPVDMVSLGKQPASSLVPYENVIVAGGVRSGANYDETMKFLDEDFGHRKLAYFTCSNFIYPKTYEEAVSRYTTELLSNYPRFKLVAAEAFEGYLEILGLSVSRKMDATKIKAWVEELGNKYQWS